MKKTLFATLLVSLVVVFGAVGTASAFSFGFGNSAKADAKADAGLSAKAPHSFKLILGARLAKLQENLEARMKTLGEKTEKQRAHLESKFEEKMEKAEEKFEKKNNSHSTSTPFMLEIGARGNAFMRGVVVLNSTSTLSVRSWGGLWTVGIASTTVINSENHLVSDFHVGDYVGVQGKVSASSGLTLDAHLLRDRTR